MADPTMDRKSEYLELTPETQATICKDAANQSAFMQLAQKIPLPGAGVRVPIIVGEPQAAWVGERDEIPKSGVTFEKKDMIPYKIAVIMPFSNEFKRDYQDLYTQISQISEMTDVIEVHDDITSEDFAVDPYAMHDFIAAHLNVDFIADTDSEHEAQSHQEATDEINRICRDVLVGKVGCSDLLKIDYAPGVYADELPACGWVKED